MRGSGAEQLAFGSVATPTVSFSHPHIRSADRLDHTEFDLLTSATSPSISPDTPSGPVWGGGEHMTA